MSALHEGMWLGTGNRIVRLQELKSGWKATDSTGATYLQMYMKDGMLAADVPTDGAKITERVPWPPRTPYVSRRRRVLAL